MIREALDRLSILPVANVPHRYGIQTNPDLIPRLLLPALLVLPIPPQSYYNNKQKRWQEAGQAFEEVAFLNENQRFTFSVTHLYLMAIAQDGLGRRQHTAPLMDGIDAYLEAWRMDMTLGDRLARPARIHIEPDIFRFHQTDYLGCAFRHQWEFILT